MGGKVTREALFKPFMYPYCTRLKHQITEWGPGKMKNQLNKTLEIAENNNVVFGNVISLIEQLIDNHEDTVKVANQIQGNKLPEYIQTFNTLRTADRTNNFLFMALDMTKEMEKKNYEMILAINKLENLLETKESETENEQYLILK